MMMNVLIAHPSAGQGWLGQTHMNTSRLGVWSWDFREVGKGNEGDRQLTLHRMRAQSSVSFSVHCSTMVVVCRGDATLARYGP